MTLATGGPRGSTGGAFVQVLSGLDTTAASNFEFTNGDKFNVILTGLDKLGPEGINDAPLGKTPPYYTTNYVPIPPNYNDPNGRRVFEMFDTPAFVLDPNVQGERVLKRFDISFRATVYVVYRNPNDQSLFTLGTIKWHAILKGALDNNGVFVKLAGAEVDADTPAAPFVRGHENPSKMTGDVANKLIKNVPVP